MTKGCIITAIDDITVDSMEALQEQLQYYEKGTTADVKNPDSSDKRRV